LAGAEPFVAGLGGLDGVIAEAGRSLSGGEKRRVAIAAALAQRSDCLILDEVTNGLDLKTKTSLLDTVALLSKEVLVIAISHDLEAFDRLETDTITLVAEPHA
jgi:ABC-type transport system involved in cytochrome bd biosynthesis fused ATPase/permease subunit